MSYDFYLVKDCGNGDIPLEGFHLNYTYNVSGMFRSSIGSEKGINVIHNKRAQEVVAVLQKALKLLQENPDIYKRMNPKNGWGTYEGAMRVVSTLIQWALMLDL